MLLWPSPFCSDWNGFGLLVSKDMQILESNMGKLERVEDVEDEKRESQVGARSIQGEFYFLLISVIFPLPCGFWRIHLVAIVIESLNHKLTKLHIEPS